MQFLAPVAAAAEVLAVAPYYVLGACALLAFIAAAKRI